MYLCPVCYRKLHLAIGFDIKQREQQIYDFQVNHKLAKSAEWQKLQLERVLGKRERNTDNVSSNNMELD